MEGLFSSHDPWMGRPRAVHFDPRIRMGAVVVVFLCVWGGGKGRVVNLGLDRAGETMGEVCGRPLS